MDGRKEAGSVLGTSSTQWGREGRVDELSLERCPVILGLSKDFGL
jgi:hypothetical protein